MILNDCYPFSLLFHFDVITTLLKIGQIKEKEIRWKKMSLKKELLFELTETQLEEFVESKDIHFALSKIQRRYYKDWKKGEKLVDIINDEPDISIKDIEEYIKIQRNS